MDDAISPSWGFLPLERYVLSQWESRTAEKDLDERRRLLVREFVDIGESERLERLIATQNAADATLPPKREWESILSPLRTGLQRQMCLPRALGNPVGFGLVWLRTCYDDDDAYAKLLDRLNAEMALDSEQNILDDRALYEYGDDWTQIFNVIPEKLLQAIKQRGYMAGNFNSNIIEMIRGGRWPDANYALTEDEKDQAIYREKTSEIHDWATRNYMFIADKTALETGEVLVVFFDSRGRVVRSNRIDPDEGEPLAGAYFEGIHIRQFWFGEAQIGPDYMPGGDCGPPFALADD